jgi:hypothetical protein
LFVCSEGRENKVIRNVCLHGGTTSLPFQTLFHALSRPIGVLRFYAVIASVDTLANWRCIQVALLALCATTFAVQSIVINGSDFVNSVTGNRFQLLGVAYQPGGSSGYDPSSGLDPLSDGTVCLRDAALMQRLGAYQLGYFQNEIDRHKV